MNWVKAVSQERFPEGSRHVMRIGDREILLIHDRGKIHAVDNMCPHMGQRLEEAEVTEEREDHGLFRMIVYMPTNLHYPIHLGSLLRTRRYVADSA